MCGRNDLERAHANHGVLGTSWAFSGERDRRVVLVRGPFFENEWLTFRGHAYKTGYGTPNFKVCFIVISDVGKTMVNLVSKGNHYFADFWRFEKNFRLSTEIRTPPTRRYIYIYILVVRIEILI